jgi:hypothetical protein
MRFVSYSADYTMPIMAEMLTVEAPPARCIAGTAYLVPRKTPVALTSIMRRQPLVSMGSGTEVLLNPALFTRIARCLFRKFAASHAAIRLYGLGG